jgi:hypothetical protein
MNDTTSLLTSKATRMAGRQRVRSRLEPGPDKILRLYNKKDGNLTFEAPANHILYSAGTIITSRLRLSTMGRKPVQAVRIGVPSSSAWTSTLSEHGAQEDPKHPEEKLDKIGLRAMTLCLILLGFVAILVLTMQ